MLFRSFLRAGDGTWSGSAELMNRTLTRAHGLDEDALRVRDGSGLSHDNRATPAAVTAVLAGLAGGDGAAAFLASLPVSGEDGTLRRRLARKPYRGRVRAKTGYASGVSCLSGYVLGADGRPSLAFSILVNGIRPGKAWKAKQLQDALCRVMVEARDGPDVD